MKAAIRGLLKSTLALVVAIAVIIGSYLAAAFFGARLPANDLAKIDNAAKTREIILVTGLLHADIAVKYTPELLSRFKHLTDTNLPFANPNLRYLAFGWGSKAFYTTAGDYSDIRPGAVFTAVTGDSAVMRITAMGDVSTIEDAIKIKLSEFQFERLMKKIDASFTQPPNYMQGVSIGAFDAFYEAKGDFNIFYPCNQWVNTALRVSGVKIGKWTPTTFALRQSLGYFGSSQP